MMSSLDIGKAYDQIVDMWASGKFDLQNGIPQHQKAISFAKERGFALDIGCGCTGRFIDLLASEGFTPEGIDVSAEMLKVAKAKSPATTFYHADFYEWSPPKKYDFITAWDSLWHLPLSLQEPVITKIVGCLNNDGVLILSFGGTHEPGEHTNRYMGPEVHYSSLGTNGFLSLLINLGCICRHLEYDQCPELHAFLIVQKM